MNSDRGRGCGGMRSPREVSTPGAPFVSVEVDRVGSVVGLARLLGWGSAERRDHERGWMSRMTSSKEGGVVLRLNCDVILVACSLIEV